MGNVWPSLIAIVVQIRRMTTTVEGVRNHAQETHVGNLMSQGDLVVIVDRGMDETLLQDNAFHELPVIILGNT